MHDPNGHCASWCCCATKKAGHSLTNQDLKHSLAHVAKRAPYLSTQVGANLGTKADLPRTRDLKNALCRPLQSRNGVRNLAVLKTLFFPALKMHVCGFRSLLPRWLSQILRPYVSLTRIES